MVKRITKTQQVLDYLKDNGSITSWEAIEKFGATRLSAIIFNLREYYEIDTQIEVAKDRNGNTCQYARYILKDVVK